MTKKATALSIVCLLLSAGAALADPEGPATELHMARGSNVVVVHGRLRPTGDCCSYAFKARAGQTLHWRYAGPNARVWMTPPGDADNVPLDVEDAIPLAQTGAYRIDVSPNLHAEDIYGRFTLTLRITNR